MCVQTRIPDHHGGIGIVLRTGGTMGISLGFDFQKCHTYLLLYILSGSHPQMAFCQISGLLKLILNDGS